MHCESIAMMSRTENDRDAGRMTVDASKDFLHRFPRRVRRPRDQLPVTENRQGQWPRQKRTDGPLSDISGFTANVPQSPISVPRQSYFCSNDVQICFDFTKGRCNRRNCKFSHDINAIIQYNSKEQGICFDFLRGECNRGPLCRFSHDLSRVVGQWMVELTDNSTDRAPPRGICYDFVRGQCPRGRQCRFSHDLLEIAVATSRANQESSNPQQWGAAAWSTIHHCIGNSRAGSWTNSVPPSSEGDLEYDALADHGSVTPTSKTKYGKSIWYDEQLAMWSPWPKDAPQAIDLDTDRLDFSSHPLGNIRVRRLLGQNLCDVIGLPRLKDSQQ
ncbi:hypothetical protein BSKO_06380 [Bryopsis sp. KO-2023]|nr:hypothetical protein BSKO_06380 [Bryopsis sp. KO-2023]